MPPATPPTGKLIWFDAAAPFPAPHVVPTTAASDCPPYAIADGGDGRLYFSLPQQSSCVTLSQIASMADDGTGPIAPVLGRGLAYDLTVSGGKLFAPDSAGVVRRMALGQALTVESVVSVAAGSAPLGIARDGAGNIWVTEFVGGRVARFPATQNGGAAEELTPVGGTLTHPFGIVAGADGRMYIAGTGTFGESKSSIARVSQGGTWEFFAAPPGTLPYHVAGGPDGDVWFTDPGNPQVLRFLSAAPRVPAGSAEVRSATVAAAAATVDPRGNETTVVFEYGPTTLYGAATPPLTVPAGTSPANVAATITKLARRTTYHVRARATNSEGTVYGPDAVVRTPDYKLLEARLAFAGATRGRLTTISRFRIINLAGGETVLVRCSGKRRGCRFTRRSYRSVKDGSARSKTAA
jgi:hypothetical protein